MRVSVIKALPHLTAEPNTRRSSARPPTRRWEKALGGFPCRRRVVGHYADSQRGEHWSQQHPSFTPFVSGLMFDRHTPKQLRADPELLEEFPPRKLAGMCNGWLTWRSPETLRLDRKMRRMISRSTRLRGLPGVYRLLNAMWTMSEEENRQFS